MIANEPAEKLVAFREKTGFSAPMLVDAEAQVIRRYGVVNEKKRTLPHPSVVIIDENGVVRWLHVDPDYKTRPSVEEIFAALDAL